MGRAIIVVDLGFGDAGKGSLVDFLTRRHPTSTVVRFNGGAQAAHNVITPEGTHHTFAQFGSGTFIPGVETHLSRFVLTNPLALFKEEAGLRQVGVQDSLARLTIDERAPITTPYQIAVNRLREQARGAERHGSCGMGIGETMVDLLAHPDEVLYAGDLSDPNLTRAKMRFLRRINLDKALEVGFGKESIEERRVFADPSLLEEWLACYRDLASSVRLVGPEYLTEILKRPEQVIFEGAQGVLLDEWFGFHPYTTWSTTTFENAQTLLREANASEEITKLGAVRAYATRHGAGPFVTESQELTKLLGQEHNTWGKWQGSFRVGHFDLVAARYALRVCGGVDGLAITNLDRWEEVPTWAVATSYTHQGGVVADLKIGRKGDLEHQEKLTQLLWESRPNLTVPTGTAKWEAKRNESYLEFLEQELQTPVAVTSSGPSAKEKIIRSTAQNRAAVC